MRHARASFLASVLLLVLSTELVRANGSCHSECCKAKCVSAIESGCADSCCDPLILDKNTCTSCLSKCFVGQLGEIKKEKDSAEDAAVIAATKALDSDDNGIVVASEIPDGYVRSPILHHDDQGIAIPDWEQVPSMPPTQGPSTFYFPPQEKYTEPDFKHKKQIWDELIEDDYPTFSLLLLLAIAFPYVLRALQAYACRGTLFDICCDVDRGPMAPRADSAEKANELGNSYWVTVNQISEGEYNGRKGWKKARADLSMRWHVAFSLSLLRFGFWHFVQPVSYFLVVRHYAKSMTTPVYILAHIVGCREFIYLLLIVWCSLFKSAFLIVNLHAEPDPNARMMQKMMYVFAPEKFLCMLLRHGGLVRIVMFAIVPFCDFCSVVVLLSEIQHASLSLALMFSCTMTLIGAISMLIRVCRKDDARQQQQQMAGHGIGTFAPGV
jgi:hypothetical protein